MTDPVNPYIAGNPVTGEAMFFGRESVFAFVRQALTGQHRDNVIVLYGQRRTGKTSALYQMRRHLDARYLCIIVDLHGLALNGIDGFIWELAQTITRALRRDHHIELPRLNRAEFAQDARVAFEDEFLPRVWSAIGKRHVLLMLDEAIRLQEQIEAGKLEREVFEYLRHLMQHHDRLNFLFALGSGLEEMEKEYAFLFAMRPRLLSCSRSRDIIKSNRRPSIGFCRSRLGIPTSRSCCVIASSIAGCSGASLLSAWTMSTPF